jgi:hypothetical protein
MSKKKKKAKRLDFTAANNIVSFNRDDVDEVITKDDLHSYGDYVVARNAARMLLSEGICPHLFQQAMMDEQEAQGMEYA